MNVQAESLQALVTDIFRSAGCDPREAACIGQHLVEANLVGHDSHGVIRVATYLRWLAEGRVFPNRQLQLVQDTPVLAIGDGQLGLGQWIGQQAVELGIEKCRQQGVAVIALRNSGHLGRIGHWAEMGLRSGLVSLHFVNTTGLGVLVAPWGGIDRRLSANPLSIGCPSRGGTPLLLDISTCMIAEGKIRVALNKGTLVPEGCLIDAQGEPTCEPRVFYDQPPGAILPFGGHKGYALGLMTELLAGALTGSGCTHPGVDRLEQGMLSIYLDPHRLAGETYFEEVGRFVQFVKSSRVRSESGEILVPGEIEERTRQQRRSAGIDLDANTWQQLSNAAQTVGVKV